MIIGDEVRRGGNGIIYTLVSKFPDGTWAAEYDSGHGVCLAYLSFTSLPVGWEYVEAHGVTWAEEGIDASEYEAAIAAREAYEGL